MAEMSTTAAQEVGFTIEKETDGAVVGLPGSRRGVL
jgi:hypothetical protein